MVSISAIVLSYNRPRLLAEAMATVAANRPDEVIVVDDGSTFDVRAAVRACFPRVTFVIAAPLTVAERLVTPRLGVLINEALRVATGDVIAYLCDDDLWADGWLDAVRTFFAGHPEARMARGDWLVFRDGEDAAPFCPVCPLDGRQMTTGNFAHRRSLAAEWPVATVSCHDDVFLWNVHRQGVDTYNVPCAGFAGWRREHEFNALHHVREHGYGLTGEAFLARGFLE